MEQAISNVQTARKDKCCPENERNPFYSKENMDSIRKALAEVKADHYTIHEPIEVD